jgi:hypothetical protein
MTKRRNNDLQNTTPKEKIEQREPQWKPEVNSCAPEGLAVLTPLMTPVVLLLKVLHLKKYKEIVKKMTITVEQQMDQTQVLQLRNVFSASYINLHIIRTALNT